LSREKNLGRKKDKEMYEKSIKYLYWNI